MEEGELGEEVGGDVSGVDGGAVVDEVAELGEREAAVVAEEVKDDIGHLRGCHSEQGLGGGESLVFRLAHPVHYIYVGLGATLIC